ncbi:MAG: bifunctional phosphoribosylaminoimidazolecarboxamide formyltransferase/IMP cyclohydrolase [Methanoculleaceae archaeon]
MGYALLSVWDKTGIVNLARALVRSGMTILSSGGTGRALAEAGIDYIEVSSYTGSPEMMGGRVKTLHPRIHGGILGRRGIDDAEMEKEGVVPIDLVVCSLYPFEEMAAKNLPLHELVEYIDIGGPAMIRAAAKNYRDVTVVVDPADYPMVMEAVAGGGLTEEDRLLLAKKAFARTAAYDAAISNYLNSLGREFPEVYTVQMAGGRTLRYGENPYQKAAVYGTAGIAGTVSLQGKEMSYNNYLDVNAAVGLVREFTECTCVIVKHNNPCGVATGTDPLTTYIEAREVDPVSAYGSIVAINREVDVDLADEICKTFVEVVIAPGFSDKALKTMEKKKNMRLLHLPPEPVMADEIRSIDGGYLIQRTEPVQEKWEVVSERDPTPVEEDAMDLAMKVCKHTKSNAIVFANSTKVLGIGAGQMSRVDAARLAISRSRFSLDGSAVASDAFLPFPDTLEEAARAGATALIQPGGSIRDQEVIDAADRLGMAMVFTGTRHFRH